MTNLGINRVQVNRTLESLDLSGNLVTTVAARMSSGMEK